MSQVSRGILCSREYSFNSCSHVRDCWSFLVRNHLFYKRFDFLKLLSRRGLYTMLAMGSFPVGIIALSVVASRIQVFTHLIMIFLTQNLSAGPVGQLFIFLILLHPWSGMASPDCLGIPPWCSLPLLSLVQFFVNTKLQQIKFCTINHTKSVAKFYQKYFQNTHLKIRKVPDRKSSVVPQPSTDAWGRSSATLYC